MIRVKVELEPFGMTIGGKQLAEIRIWNSTARGLTSKHNYEYEMLEPNPLDGDPVMCRGSIKGYDRQQPVLNLVSKVLQEALDKTS
jgi:hypothetical protein